jgi:amidase
MSDEIARLDATQQAALIASNEMSPAELVESAIRRIERANPDINAVIHPLFDKAMAEARGELPDGPFRGVPILLKDLGPFSKGDPWHGGMGVLKKLGFIAPFDSFMVKKLRKAGFVIVGKTNTPELGILPTTEPRAHGASKNPYDKTRTTGGSSGGSAAAVAAGMTPVAQASDGGGSIRIPAACCGLVGLKPTRGRVSMGPSIGDINHGIVVENAVTRTVRDTAALLDVLAGPMPGDPYYAPPPLRPFAEEVDAAPGRLRIGFTTTRLTSQGQIAPAEPDCIAAVERAAALLADLGHELGEVRIDALFAPEYVPRFIAIWAAGVAAGVNGWEDVLNIKIGADDVEPLTWALTEMGNAVSSSSFLRNWTWMQVNARQVQRFWKDHDILLTPTTAEPPPPLGTFLEPPGNPLESLFRAAAFAPFTPPWNVTGQPALSLPLHRTASGLPIGVQLVGAYAREDLLIRLASQIEEAAPFQHAATM